MHLSDRGVQYTSFDYTQLLQDHDILTIRGSSQRCADPHRRSFWGDITMPMF